MCFQHTESLEKHMVNNRSGEKVLLPNKIGKVALENQFIDSVFDTLLYM